MSDRFDKILPLGLWAKKVRQRTAPKWLIHNILPADNLVLLSGVPKDAQKTFLAMTAALMVATGKSVGAMKPPSAEKVLYIYEEGDYPGTLARFDALAAGHGFGSIDDIENLHFAHRLGFSLEDNNWMNTVSDLVHSHDIKLVIIDTLAKCMQGDENSVQAVGSAIRSVNKLREAECTVMFVHHTRKEDSRLSSKSHGTPEPDYDIRGSSALCGTYETHWAVRSYCTGINGESEKYLMINGKEFPLRAYRYRFEFTSEEVTTEYGIEDQMKECRLVLDQQNEVPYVEPKVARAKKDKDL